MRTGISSTATACARKRLSLAEIKEDSRLAGEMPCAARGSSQRSPGRSDGATATLSGGSSVERR